MITRLHKFKITCDANCGEVLVTEPLETEPEARQVAAELGWITVEHERYIGLKSFTFTQDVCPRCKKPYEDHPQARR